MKSAGFRQKLFYSFGQFGNGVYNGLNNGIMGLFVSAYTGNAFLIGYLSNTRTMEGVIIQPLVGRWSDRTNSRLGRRRPFILFGIPISVLFLALIPLAGHADPHIALWLIILSIVLFSITWNIAGDPYQALMIDITPNERERSLFNAVLSVVALVGQVALLLYAAFASLEVPKHTYVHGRGVGHGAMAGSSWVRLDRPLGEHNIPDAVFFLCAGFLLLTYAVVFFGVREPKDAVREAHVENRIPLRVYVREMREFKEALKLLVSIFFLWTGLNAIIPYLTVFTKKEMHVSDSKAILMYLVVILSSALAAYPFGKLAERHGARRYIVIGTALMIVAGVGGMIVPTYITLIPVAVLAGVGFSATTALTYPYLSQLVPGSKMGVFTGLQAAFASVAVPLSVAAAGTLIHFFGYRSIFGMLAAMMVIDIAFLLRIDESAAKRQITDVARRDETIAAQGLPVPAS